jgi:hypothetical protein
MFASVTDAIKAGQLNFALWKQAKAICDGIMPDTGPNGPPQQLFHPRDVGPENAGAVEVLTTLFSTVRECSSYCEFAEELISKRKQVTEFTEPIGPHPSDPTHRTPPNGRHLTTPRDPTPPSHGR